MRALETYGKIRPALMQRHAAVVAIYIMYNSAGLIHGLGPPFSEAYAKQSKRNALLCLLEITKIHSFSEVIYHRPFYLAVFWDTAGYIF